MELLISRFRGLWRTSGLPRSAKVSAALCLGLDWPLRRSQWRNSSMTSFCFVLFTRWKRVRRPLLTVFKEIWPPKCCRPPCWPLKRHFLAWLCVIWAIIRENAPTGHLSRRVREKIHQNKKDKALYFTYLPSRSLTVDWHKFWNTCSSRGRN